MAERRTRLRHEFVGVVPDRLEEGVLYISTAFATTLHLCCCGCGLEVVAPLSPADWSLTYDGQSVSLVPSIGNRGFPCRSHYLIERGRIRWLTQRGDPAAITTSAGRERSVRRVLRRFGLPPRRRRSAGRG